MTSSLLQQPAGNIVGPSFIALQVRDLEVSRAFYVDKVGLTAATENPPGAIVFQTEPTPFAIRMPLVNLDATSKLGWGISLWMAAMDADVLHARLAEAGVPIVLPPAMGPFGRFFAFSDPDGYILTIHTKQPKSAK